MRKMKYLKTFEKIDFILENQGTIPEINKFVNIIMDFACNNINNFMDWCDYTGKPVRLESYNRIWV
jgi:hypothetical protein